mmetsp:Transcript_67474/g.188270  ORF Transcript_67474/g.188270 Transcript_67474/m.188270 type:complete len:435 (-) Transcript_67474:749-2053(-)
MPDQVHSLLDMLLVRPLCAMPAGRPRKQAHLPELLCRSVGEPRNVPKAFFGGVAQEGVQQSFVHGHSASRVPVEQPRDCRPSSFRHVKPRPIGIVDRLALYSDGILYSCGLERQRVHQHEVQDHAHGPHVSRLPGASHERLGGHVLQSPANGGALVIFVVHVSVRQVAQRAAKVDQLEVPVAVKHKVVWLDVPMNEALVMHLPHTYEDLPQQPRALLGRGALIRLEESQQRATAELLHDVYDALGCANHLEDARDVRLRTEEPVQHPPSLHHQRVPEASHPDLLHRLPAGFPERNLHAGALAMKVAPETNSTEGTLAKQFPPELVERRELAPSRFFRLHIAVSRDWMLGKFAPEAFRILQRGEDCGNGHGATVGHPSTTDQRRVRRPARSVDHVRGSARATACLLSRFMYPRREGSPAVAVLIAPHSQGRHQGV